MPVRVQRIILLVSIILFGAKIVAWYLTHSVAIFTDALESSINVITGFIGLYSVSLAAKPRDLNHPFGHGKIEFISAAIEGSLIFLAGIWIIYEAAEKLITPQPLHQIDYGILITGCAGFINYLVGTFALREGKKLRSVTVITAGKHLRVDAWSSLALILGLGLLLLTGWWWLDSLIAGIFALFIMITGYRVVRKSLSGIMDESDGKLLEEVIGFLQENRRAQWIDMHNMRVIQYGDVMHVDAHMTLPWYFRVREGEREIHLVEDLIRQRFGARIEIFIHIDACAPYSCKLCALENCAVRQEKFRNHLLWNSENVWKDSKHGRMDPITGQEAGAE